MPSDPTPLDSVPLYEVRQVCRYFRQGTLNEVRALDDVTLAIERGAFCALTGPSGSGKSTLLALLGALERPTSGSVLFGSRDLSRASDTELARIRRRLGFVFQNFSLIRGLCAWENATYALIPRGATRQERYETATSLLTRLGLGQRMEDLPEELSGGEQQRLAMARALAGSPEVLLADEPTSNLDRAAGETLIGMLSEIHAGGTTVIVSSHDAQLLSLSTVMFELDGGRLKGGAS